MAKPSITGTIHTLPFDKLSPCEFERLCLWLVRREGWKRVEHLGAAGSEQGRDIIAWRGDCLWAFQCKRVKTFGPKDALAEVDKILALPKDQRPVGLTFIVTCDISVNTRDQVRERCAGEMECRFWARTELDQKVKCYPNTVKEFFQVERGITVGNITQIGKIVVQFVDERVFKWLKLEQRIGFILLGVLVIGTGFLLYQALNPRSPNHMTGEFNVAVAEFIVVDQEGAPVRSEDGQALANFLIHRLETSFDELGLQISYELWPPAHTGRIRGTSREERAQAAEALAQRIGAHVIIYGVVTQAADQSQFAPEFYVNYRGFEKGQEIIGQHALGSPLAIVLPFEAAQALTDRANALTLLIIGLAYYSTDDFERALDYFKQAEAIEGWLKCEGKEFIYLLLGSATARLGSRSKSTENLSSAADYYTTALTIDPTYARAKLGQAIVLYLTALGDPTDPSFNTVDLSQLNEAEDTFESVLGLGDPPESANIETRVHFGVGQIHFVRAMAIGNDGLTRAEAEFEQIVQEYEGGNTGVADLAGHAYARLGAIAWLQGNTSVAAEHYNRAAELVTPYYQAYYYARLGEIYADADQTALAIDAVREAFRIAQLYGDEESAMRYTRRLNELEAGE